LCLFINGLLHHHRQQHQHNVEYGVRACSSPACCASIYKIISTARSVMFVSLVFVMNVVSNLCFTFGLSLNTHQRFCELPKKEQSGSLLMLFPKRICWLTSVTLRTVDWLGCSQVVSKLSQLAVLQQPSCKTTQPTRAAGGEAAIELVAETVKLCETVQILQKQTQVTLQCRQHQIGGIKLQTECMSISALTMTAPTTARQQQGSPDKVIAAVAEAFHDVGLIVLGTHHDDGHHGIRHRLAQLCAELVPCMHDMLPFLICHTNFPYNMSCMNKGHLSYAICHMTCMP